jgi:hypothetical protein
MSRDHPQPLRDVTANTKTQPPLLFMLGRVYRAVAWHIVDQICYSMYEESVYI